MKTLVTGATGLLGGWLCRRLLDAGHQVRALVRDERRLPADLAGRVEVAVGDVTEPRSLPPAMAGVEWVFHAAGIPEQAVRDEGIFERVNHQGTRHVLEAARDTGVRRLVYTSTMDVLVAPRGGTVTEDAVDPQPRPTAYERSKQAAERAVRAFADQLDVVFVNPAAIYGPGATPTMLTGTIAKLVRGELPLLPPGGMSVSYVEGLADAHLAAAERGRRGRGYLVADAHLTPHALAEVVSRLEPSVRVPATAPEWLLLLLGKLTTPLLTRLGREPLADPGQLLWLFNDTHVDAARARQELGFVPTPVEDGVRKTIAGLRSAGQLP